MVFFNHESPLRGETFVTKKIVKGLCDILHNKSEKLYIGNLMLKEIGDMQKIMFMQCGKCYKKKTKRLCNCNR